ncbi:MAG: UDP-4-amino-4,6-dideoxy-N-acetyl-beta-L-altrosamine transaminase [Azonexus sp.]
MIPYGRQSIDQGDIDAVVATLRSDWLTQGPAIPAFEGAVAARGGARHAVAVSNATAALHLACLALEVGPGDRVWTSPNTFVASANCARYCGAEVDFVDIDAQTRNLSVTALAEKFARAQSENRLPKVLIPVHFAGQACDMAEIADLARRHGCRIIEDASHAIGATYRETAVGSCRHADITVFSFHPVKIITTGEGGMALTNDDELARRLQRLRSHGITRDPAEMTEASPGGWYYQQTDLGFNYRMTDLQAALGSSQLARLDGFLAARRHRVARYDEALAPLPIDLPRCRPDRQSAWHLYPIGVAPGRRATLFARFREAGIGVQVHYIPVHLQPYYRRLGFAPGDFPAAEAYYAGALSLPLYPGLTDADQDQVIGLLRAALG